MLSPRTLPNVYYKLRGRVRRTVSRFRHVRKRTKSQLKSKLSRTRPYVRVQEARDNRLLRNFVSPPCAAHDRVGEHHAMKRNGAAEDALLFEEATLTLQCASAVPQKYEEDHQRISSCQDSEVEGKVVEHPHTTGFYDLPREVRDEIYSLLGVIAVRKPFFTINLSSGPGSARLAVPQDASKLLLLNKQTFAEIMSLCYGRIRFLFGHPGQLLEFACHRPFATRYISKLTLMTAGESNLWAIALAYTRFKNLEQFSLWSLTQPTPIHPYLWSAIVKSLKSSTKDIRPIVLLKNYYLTDEQRDEVPDEWQIEQTCYDTGKYRAIILKSDLKDPSREYMSIYKHRKLWRNDSGTNHPGPIWHNNRFY